jgi:hypothetical protein
MRGQAVTPAGAETRAFDNYLRVREEVARMKAAAGAGDADPSRYWVEELSNIDYMSEASPLIIRKLRHHAFHITGLRPYDYREYGDKQLFFERRLRALAALAGGTSLLVPESAVLGGFGYTIDGQLYNVDTIKFFEVLVGMERAGLLRTFREPGRRLVWEIGGGWGGFAYQFKTLFPDTTYVIVDFPELFLFSATYLSTVFPDATIRYWRPDAATFDDWQQADFVFVPTHAAGALRQVRPDLLVNLVSFQEMTTGQVEAYTALAASTGCPTLYSLNRDRSHYNAELDSVAQVLSQHYDLREIRLLGSDYTKAIKKDSAVSVEDAAQSGRVPAERYRHLTGTLRAPAPEMKPGLISGVAVAEIKPGFIDAARPQARVGIGVTLHNRGMYLAEALDSLLAQSFHRFQLVLVDDGSTDATEAIARAYERRDPRVRYVRFDERRGMIAAWRAAFELATADRPDYFAWASDHDRWHPHWLERLVAELEQHREAIVAYPLTERMDAAGMPLPKPARRFETSGVIDLGQRWRMFSRSDAVAAGDMVYGLMRPDAVRRAGIFRDVLCPDRLLLAELSLQGQIRQVPDVLWFRRQFSTGSVSRQRSSLFAPGAARPGVLTPPWYMHARSLWATYGPAGGAAPPPPYQHPAAVARLVALYAGSYAIRHYVKGQHEVLSAIGLPRWLYKQARHGTLLGVHKALLAARHAGITPFVERMCERLTGRPRPWRRTTTRKAFRETA